MHSGIDRLGSLTSNLLFAIALTALAACGGEEGEPDQAADGNLAPTILGNPQTSIRAGTNYSFKPLAQDPDGDPLIFGIDGKPGWLSFDQKTGELSGRPGAANVGMHRGIVVWVSDGQNDSLLPAFDLNVMPASSADNRAPQISGTPQSSIVTGQNFDFIPVASDPDGDLLTFQIANLPSWAAFDPNTGRLNGTPVAADIGVYSNIVIGVTDGFSSAALDPFVLVINPPPSLNSVPQISGRPSPTILEGAGYSFQPQASDADGDTLSFQIFNPPPWASFDSATGALTGTPGPIDVGSYRGIAIVVTDGIASASLPSFEITVATRNSAPTISGAPGTSASTGVAYAFQPQAVDADGDALTFSIGNRPSWAAFDTSTGRLSGTPGIGDVGSYASIAISVSDGTANAQLPSFTITVTSGNRAPIISGTPQATVLTTSTYSFMPAASDPDGDPLSFSISSQPVWAAFDSTTGRLSGTPTAADIGSYANIRISVSDGTVSAQLPAFSITVTPTANGSATLSWTPPTENTDGSPLTDLAGYKVYWGSSSGNYTNSATIDNEGVTTYVVTDLLEGTTYYFTTTAFNELGVESSYSNEATKTIP